MSKKTSYKNIILRSIVITVLTTLIIATVYTYYMKKEAIKTFIEVDGKKTSQLVFETLYSSMSKGWDKQDLENIITRVNNIDTNMQVDIYRSPIVAYEFGEIERDLKVRKENPFVHYALQGKEQHHLIENKTIEYYYPIIANNECLSCHTQAEEKGVLGVIKVTHPIVDLKVSLTSLVNFFAIFVILFTLIVLIALFIKLDKHLVKPIKHFIHNVNLISTHKDITKRVDIDNHIEEIHSMQEVFNNMLDSLEFQFYNDELTGLPNRKRLIEVINSKHSAVLMILNIDKFQEINDLYGEEEGDTILKKTAQLLKESIPKEAKLFKLHADEYAIYYRSDLDYEQIHSFALHLNSCMENHKFFIDNSTLFINATIGIAFGNNYLLNNADIAMKIAKNKKEKYLLYEASMNAEYEYEQNLKWTSKVKDAIENNKIEPLFQPIVDTQTKEVVKYEALMRMVDDQGDFIAPIHFLDLAKKNKLYPQLTKIMLEKTFSTFKDLPFQVSINISVEDILNKMVHDTIIEKLAQYNLKNRVVFEIVESEGIENFEEVSAFIDEVKAYGAKISIDDFGTGYSNFEYLLKLKVDFIKIDASMIKDIDTNQKSQMVTKTIMDFAQKMHIKTIAEYIHSHNVYAMVKKIGIDYAQGYFFGAPQTIEELLEEQRLNKND
jgi:diguanylate cyclase (GGDEF)-like protein